jgi:hypothetical protein
MSALHFGHGFLEAFFTGFGRLGGCFSVFASGGSILRVRTTATNSTIPQAVKVSHVVSLGVVANLIHENNATIQIPITTAVLFSLLITGLLLWILSRFSRKALAAILSQNFNHLSRQKFPGRGRYRLIAT